LKNYAVTISESNHFEIINITIVNEIVKYMLKLVPMGKLMHLTNLGERRKGEESRSFII
jgi:hypothetical protein